MPEPNAWSIAAALDVAVAAAELVPVALPEEVPVAEEPPAAEPDDEPVEFGIAEAPISSRQLHLGLVQT